MPSEGAARGQSCGKEAEHSELDSLGWKAWRGLRRAGPRPLRLPGDLLAHMAPSASQSQDGLGRFSDLTAENSVLQLLEVEELAFLPEAGEAAESASRTASEAGSAEAKGVCSPQAAD